MQRIFSLLLGTVIIHCAMIGEHPGMHAQANAADSREPHLELALPHNPAANVLNPDAIMLDANPLSATYEQIYAQQWFSLRFAAPVINAAAETQAVVDWRAIDERYATLRAGLQQIHEQYGRFELHKVTSDNSDQTSPAARSYHLRFARYVPAKKVIEGLRAVEGVEDCNLQSGAIQLMSYPSDPAFAKIDAELNDFYQSPTTEERQDRHRLGWQWTLHRIKAPMAWEVSKGKKEIVIGVDDTFKSTHINFNNDPQHPDILEINGANGGNFFRITAGNIGNGSKTTAPIFDDGHGFQNLMLAVGLENSTGIVGMAPGVRALATEWIGHDYINLDVDEDAGNGIITPVDVMNCSYDHSNVKNFHRDEFKDILESGTVIVAAQANNIYNPGTKKVNSGWKGFSDCEVIGDPPEAKLVLWGKTPYPAGLVYTDPDPAKDVKVISVGVYNDQQTYKFRNNCSRFEQHYELVYSPNTFPIDWNFAPNTEKFPAPGISESERKVKKEDAFVDVVMPHNDVAGVAHDGHGNPIPEKYGFWIGGTSRSVPVVSGIVALMRSIDRNLGTAGGLDVQRKAYDIVTFTTDKILDNPDNIRDDAVEIQLWDDHYFTKYNPHIPADNEGNCTELQFEYKEQVHDPLHRWWAQRVGFGQVNAFRCLAHAIPHKGAYEYNSTQSLSFDPLVTNEDGVQLMHMGSWKESGIAVLDEGGVKYDGEADYKNNNGVTKINGASTQLVVGVNKVLAIDGIVTTDDVIGGEITTGNASKILMTGYLHNTKLSGNIQIGDLLINTGPGGRASVKPRVSGRLVEISGYVRVKGDGEILVDAGTLRLHPGAGIYLNGSKDLIVQDGATLEMNAGTAILGTEGRKLIVQSGGTLIIKEDARNVAFYCDVVLEGGASMIIEDDARVILGPVVTGFFTSDPNLPVGNGNFIVQAGATATLQGTASIYGGNILQGIYNYEGGAITVETGGQFTVAQNADALIQVPISVQAQATMLIDRNAVVELHEFFIAKDADMEIEDGCWLYLTNNDFSAYSSRGRIEFRGTAANRIEVTARRFSVCDDGPAYARIIAFGAASDLEQLPPVLSSWAKIQYTDFKNVQMVVRDNHVKDPIRNCSFFADHDQTDGSLNRLLELSNGRLEVPFDSPINIPTEINDCQFSYVAPRVVVPDDPNVYPYKGLFTRGINQLQINTCSFENLHFGVSTLACGDVRIATSQFRNCDIGNIDNYSTVELCANLFEMVEFASVFEGSQTSGHYDNQYMTVEKAVQLLGGPFQAFRGNLFSEFHQGIVADDARAELTGWRVSTFAGPRRTLFGRNSFTVLPIAQSVNPYIDLNQSKYFDSWADVALTDFDGWANFYCGMNDMAEQSNNHLYSVVNRTTEFIDGSINFWHDPLQPVIGFMRAFNIGTNGSPLNQSASYGGGCGPADTDECLVPIQIVCPGDDYVNDGAWAALSPDDPYLDLARDNARSFMMNVGLTAECRRDKAYDAFQAAWLGDTRATDLTTLKQEYAQISGEFGVAKILEITAYMLMGQIDEYLGQSLSAINNYGNVLTNYPAARSARYAAWRISFLMAEQTDPTLGELYEQELQNYFGKVITDLREIDQLPKPALPDASGAAALSRNLTLHANVPNPFSLDTELRFALREGANVRLLVTDMMGRVIANLLDGFQSAGEHSLQWRADQVPAGVYYCRLESDGETLMRKMILLP